MTAMGETTTTPQRSRAARALLFAMAAMLSGCAAVADIEGRSPRDVRAADTPGTAEQARTALAAGNLDAADALLSKALAPLPAGSRNAGAIPQRAETPELLVLRAELRIRQGRFPEAETDAVTAMALVPATAPPADAAATPPPARSDAKPAADAAPPPRPRPLLTQRSIHLRVAQLYEDTGRDDFAEQHIESARQICASDAELVQRRDCNRERQAMIRIRIARGDYVKAEPLVLAAIAEVQQRYGAYDLRLAEAFCHAARFYARQGKYTLSGPLFTRSFDLWKTSREEAFVEHSKALAAGLASPFDTEFLQIRAGHAPFAAPCGLEDQPSLLYKLGKPDVAADAIRYQQELWAADTEAAGAAVAQLDALLARGADALDVASARHAVAWIAMNRGDMDRAELELRQVIDAYGSAWPSLPLSERRYRAEDFLAALERQVTILRSKQRFAEAVALGQRATEVAAATIDAYDSMRLDTLLSLAITYREMRDPAEAERAAGGYLDAVVAARGDTSPDYAWALRTISYAYLLQDEVDASQRMEMQAKAIWAKQSAVAPAF